MTTEPSNPFATQGSASPTPAPPKDAGGVASNGAGTASPENPMSPNGTGTPAGNGAVLSPKDAFKKALSQGMPASNLSNASTSDDSEDSGSNVITFVDNVIENAITLGVSDIHIEPYKESARLRYRRDGVLNEIEEYRDYLFNNYSAIITRIKILSSLDISERRLPQDGAISFPMPDDFVDLRVSILPTGDGERIVMRIMDKSSLNMPLDKLGFPEEMMPAIQKAINSPQGMILVTGPTGSGKSTTLYAVLNALNDPEVNILTAEDPVEFGVEGIGQVHVKENIGLTFAAALRSFLRQDPEVIMVGEIRDKETGDISVKAALTGHLVLSTLHTNSAPSTVTRLLNMGIPNYLVTSSLILVIAQRLARIICSDCKQVDPQPDQNILKALGFTEEQLQTIKVYKGAGCETCMHSGSKGRRAIHEVLVITKSVKEAILKNVSDIELTNIAITNDGFKTMQQRGLELLLDGTISLGEFQRVLMIED